MRILTIPLSATLVQSQAPADSVVRSGRSNVVSRSSERGGAPSTNDRRPAYRVVVFDIRSGFNRQAALHTIARLFGRNADRLIDQSERLPIARLMSHAGAATRLAELLTAAGCRCSIEIDVTASHAPGNTANSGDSDVGTAQPAAPADTALVAGIASRSAEWVRRATVRRRPRWAIACAAHLARSAKAIGAASEQLLHRVRSRLAKMWTPGVQQFVFGIGALATIGVLSTAIPGHTVPIGQAALGGEKVGRDQTPRAPVIDLGQAMRPLSISVRQDGGSASNGLQRAATSLGVVSLERTGRNAQLWELKWNDAKLRELRVEMPPSFVARHGADKWQAAIGEFGDEVALVVDTGEPRSMFCQANKTMLVVLSKAGAAHLHDIPGNCVELETVTVDERRLLMHFYDRAAPSLAYEAGRIVRVVP